MKKSHTQKVQQAQRICAKLQTKLIYKHRWKPHDRTRWDFAINVIVKSHQRT
jgi:hypothetical protein